MLEAERTDHMMELARLQDFPFQLRFTYLFLPIHYMSLIMEVLLSELSIYLRDLQGNHEFWGLPASRHNCGIV